MVIIAALAACGDEPTFTTEQGLDVFDATGTASKKQFDCALDLIFANSFGLAWSTVDGGMAIRIKKKPSVHGYFSLDNADLYLGPNDMLPNLAHEMGHAIQWYTAEKIDDNHTDGRFFCAPASMEVVAKTQIREACL